MVNLFLLQTTGNALIDNLWLVIVLAFVIFFLFIIFFVSRYRKYKTNEYVIHFRRGKIKRAGTGGTVVLWPVFDEVIVIPTTTCFNFLNLSVLSFSITKPIGVSSK